MRMRGMISHLLQPLCYKLEVTHLKTQTIEVEKLANGSKCQGCIMASASR